MTIKMNQQTVFTTLGNSSTLEFQAIHCVPVYEPAERGWYNYYFHDQTITLVNEHGDVTRKCVRTGQTTQWQTRPSLKNVVTLGMKHNVGGLYFEFKQDGSILFSSKKGSCYWGPIQEMTTEKEPLQGWARTDYQTLDELWQTLMEEHSDRTDPMVILQGEIDDWWATRMDKRWRRNTSIEEEMEYDTKWVRDMKERLANDSRVYNVPEVRKAHEDQIAKIQSDIEYNRGLLLKPDQKCSECRREGVCMCYT